MNLELALLADYANISQEGKLNVMGIFNVISAPAFPAQHPEMRLVLRFRASAAEKGQSRRLDVKLVDADGREGLTLSGQLRIPTEFRRANVEITNILTLVGVRFEKEGVYEFRVLVDNDDKGFAKLEVVQRLEASPEAS